MTDLSPEQESALAVAHELVDMGVPVFTAKPNHSDKGPEFHYPSAWMTYRPHHRQVDMWRPGDALAMVTGHVFDVLDVDPRNGGLEGWADLEAADAVPTFYGVARTPSEGMHYLIARTLLAKTSKAAKGVDLQAGDARGEGRGFVFIAPTVRISRHGARQGEAVAYRWVEAPEAPEAEAQHAGPMERLRGVVMLNRGGRGVQRASAIVPITAEQREDRPLVDDDLAAFADMVDTSWTPEQAGRVIDGQIQTVEAAKEGEINNALGGAARVLGRFVASGYLDEDKAVAMLLTALASGGVHSDEWNVQNRKDWTAATVIAAGLANGAKEPWEVSVPGDTPVSTPVKVDSPVPAPVASAAPELQITGAADMAYWLQNALGSERLAGFFLRDSQVVHTPRVDELGYVAPRHPKDANGPAQIQAVTAGTLTAKIQYAFRCWKEVDAKDADGKKTGQKVRVPALFPLEAATRAVNAPEAMGMLRPLAGLTMTPIVRADGSVLATPGYDAASGYLYLPGQGVNVEPVPLEPAAADVQVARGWLEHMLAGFPWETKDDLVNYLGLLLTPMLRLLCPPTYKLFAIGAHQPGSGKTLLADIATILHGGVLRSEVPEDEPEWRKQTTAILANTTAPVVHIDNVTGVLKSGVLTGLLTAGQESSDRELGTSRMVTTLNDRVWVVTGNNLVLSGDLVRRTIIVMIDPNMANPETRSFAIEDLKGWVRDHRNKLLWSLLVLVRHWVAQGRPLEERRQSDSFTAWERTVGGILAAAGFEGAFDAESGKRAAAGGDDDGLAGVLEHAWHVMGPDGWLVNTLLERSQTTSADVGDFVGEARDWLPGVILEKLARSEAGGRKSFGRWLMNRRGRWVTGSDGATYVLREDGPKTRTGQRWRVERTERA